jgi:predicted CoA-binding protein
MSDEQPNWTDERLRELLERSQTVAVVGMSTDPDKAAHRVPALLLDAGVTVIPVHPTATEILGQTAYASLEDVPVHIDIVDVFRPPAEAPGIAGEAETVGANTLWLQLGITSGPARDIAEASGLVYLEDICIGETVQRLGIRK